MLRLRSLLYSFGKVEKWAIFVRVWHESPNRSDMPFDNYEIYYVPIVCTTFEPTILSSLLHQHEKWKQKMLSPSFVLRSDHLANGTSSTSKNLLFYCFCVSLIDFTYMQQQTPTNVRLPRDRRRRRIRRKYIFHFYLLPYFSLGRYLLCHVCERFNTIFSF